MSNLQTKNLTDTWITASCSEYLQIIQSLDVQVIEFLVADGGSKKIRDYLVLPEFKISLLDEALQRSRNMNQPLVAAWLMSQFKQ
ncbi:MAG: hypothetical protein WBA93_07790 [Microcoleaceae cyanobacterium]